MPIHDWTRVSAGTYHAFHLSWIAEIQLALNGGLLPESYYALAEQIIGPYGPDVLTLQTNGSPPSNGTNGAHPPTVGGVAVATARPRTRFTAAVEASDYAAKNRLITIRHRSDDYIIALLELVSPGNKSSWRAVESFVEKAVAVIRQGYHLLFVDLFPPTPRDPAGLHGEVWTEFSRAPYVAPPGEPLTLAAYSASGDVTCYVEPTAVGRELLSMPLFLKPEIYVEVPLEATYQGAYRGVPQRWKAVLEAPA